MRVGLFAMVIAMLLLSSEVWPTEIGLDDLGTLAMVDGVRIAASATLALWACLVARRLVSSLRQSSPATLRVRDPERRAGADRRRTNAALPPGMVDRRRADRRQIAREVIAQRVAEEGERRRAIESLLARGEDRTAH